MFELFDYNINLKTAIETNIQYIQRNLNYFIAFAFLIFFVSLTLFILISYFVLKWFKKNIEDSNVLFYQYNKKSQKILDLYGDYKLTKAYLVRHPFSKFISLMLNVVSFYNYEKLIHESQENFPYHSLIIFEIKLPNNMRKMLLLEKNNCINLCDNFIIHNSQDVKQLKIQKEKHTLNTVLLNTQSRIGSKKFFNWHLYTNNCQEFIKEILITLNAYNTKNKLFIFQDKLMKIMVPSDFMLHVGNSLCVFYNIFEKYVFNSSLLN